MSIRIERFLALNLQDGFIFTKPEKLGAPAMVVSVHAAGLVFVPIVAFFYF